MQGWADCWSEEVVWFFSTWAHSVSSIHRNTPHPEDVHEKQAQQSSSFQQSFMTVLNNWSHVHNVPFSMMYLLHLVRNKINISTGKFAPMPNCFFPIKVGGHGSLFSQGAIHFPWKQGNKACSCVITCHALALFCCCSVFCDILFVFVLKWFGSEANPFRAT